MTEPTTATAPPRADNWAEDHRRKGTPLKKNTRQTADEARAQPNEAFCRYYRSQLGPLLAEDEWDSMEACMRTALPVTFRLSGPPDDAGAHALRDDMEARLVAPLRSQESVALQPPQPLPHAYLLPLLAPSRRVDGERLPADRRCLARGSCRQPREQRA